MKTVSLIAVAIASVLALTACNAYKTTSSGESSSEREAVSTSSAGDATNEEAAVVTFSDNGFAPSTLNVKVGQKVVFENASSSTLEVNSAPHPTHTLYQELNIGKVAGGASGSTSFAKAGTYKYHNHLNAGQNGTIVVK
ncbi:cupredoxin domain-containing protein [Candidatus Curtissbacteria bacterium]|nr:cupredoxin domain-containing protein [Candidatus Curtissbacteria bacterium]